MQSNGRILLLSVAIPPDPLTGAARAGRFRNRLPSCGFDVEVIAEGPLSSSIPGVRRVTRSQRSASQFHSLRTGFDGPLPLPSSACSSPGPVSLLAHLGALHGATVPATLPASLTRLAPAGSLTDSG